MSRKQRILLGVTVGTIGVSSILAQYAGYISERTMYGVLAIVGLIAALKSAFSFFEEK